MSTTQTIELSNAARDILTLRSVKDRFAIRIPLHNELIFPALPLQELVDRKFCERIDRAWLYGDLCDVYQLTPDGIAYCDAEGIIQH